MYKALVGNLSAYMVLVGATKAGKEHKEESAAGFGKIKTQQAAN